MQTVHLRHRLEVAGRHAWFRFKVLLRQNTKTDKNYFAGDAAIRLCNGGLPQGVRITCSGRSDGVGKQAMARISCMNFAKAFGATYVDTPFVHIDHAPGRMKDWVAAWEQRFNFGKGEERIGDRDYEIVDYQDYLLNGREITDKVVLRLQQCYWFNRRYPDSLEAIAPSLRNKFGTPPRTPAKDRLVVAIHVRRGDVGQGRNTQRFTPNARILRSIAELRGILDELGLEAVFQIHSEGDPSEFAEFSRIGCELFLDTDATWTMGKLAEADILVMAKSSFSYIAAILSEGIKFYEPMFDPPLSSWIARRKDGTFDLKRARESIKAYTTSHQPAPPAESALVSLLTPSSDVGVVPT